MNNRTASLASHLPLAHSSFVVRDLITTIVAQRQYLSEVDGAIGDGDHGVNMSKGFAQAGEKIDRLDEQNGGKPVSFVHALDALAETLIDGIGGSMGPLYGSFFMSFADVLRGHDQLDARLFASALRDATQAVHTVGEAKVGDKTLMDTLVPACDAFEAALRGGVAFSACLDAMAQAAHQGMESTRALQARVGRASRLGPRSIGVLDAGACSSCFIVQSLARSVASGLEE